MKPVKVLCSMSQVYLPVLSHNHFLDKRGFTVEFSGVKYSVYSGRNFI